MAGGEAIVAIAAGALADGRRVLPACGADATRQTLAVSNACAGSAITFETSDNCLACHNGLTTPAGEDVSIGVGVARVDDGQLLARSVLAGGGPARDDRPSGRAAEIEDECATCHMPMARDRSAARRAARRGVRAPAGRRAAAPADAAGGRRRVVHALPQIAPDVSARRESFTGGFVIGRRPRTAPRMFGPFEVDGAARASCDPPPASMPTEGRARPAVGAVRDVPHALHERARAER